MKPSFQNIEQLSTQERATRGAALGSAAGLGVSGPLGAVMGGSIGAVVSRAAGVVKTGEHEDELNKQKIHTTLEQLGALSKGAMSFQDAAVRVPRDPSFRMENLDVSLPNRDRSLYDVDKSNPLTNRTMAVAQPIAKYLVQGINNLSDTKNERHAAALANASGLLTNTLQADAPDISTVYSRARQLVEKMGISEQQLRAFISSSKDTVSPQEAKQIKFGLDRIFS